MREGFPSARDQRCWESQSRQSPRQLSGLIFAVASVYDRLEFLEGNLLVVEALFRCRPHHSISDRHQVGQNGIAGLQFSYKNLWLKGVCSHTKVDVPSTNIESKGIHRSPIWQSLFRKGGLRRPQSSNMKVATLAFAGHSTSLS